MKLLIIAPYFFERHRWMISAYKTALALSKHIEVVVLTTGTPATEQVNSRLRVYRLKDWFMPDPINYSIVPGLIPGLEHVLGREQPDLVLVNKHMFFTSLAVWWLRLRGKKVVIATDTFPGLNWHPRKWFVRVAMSLYAVIIGWPLLKVANQVVLFHEGLIPMARRLGLRYTVIHNGVDLDVIDKATIAPDFERHDRQIHIGYIGRMETIKGYEDFLSVAQQLAPQYANARFYCIGSFHGKEQLVDQIRSTQIIFTGHRDDIPSILKGLDIFVLPSYSEGLPNALMEAMAAGCACISSNVGGVKTLIQPDVNGLVFSPGDRPALQGQIIRLLNDSALRRQFGSAAQQTIRRGYDWNQIAAEYLKLFRSMLQTS